MATNSQHHLQNGKSLKTHNLNIENDKIPYTLSNFRYTIFNKFLNFLINGGGYEYNFRPTWTKKEAFLKSLLAQSQHAMGM